MGWLQHLCVLCTFVSCVITVKVHTKLGELEGDEYKTHTGKRVYSFLGVPYAQPPIGEDRFEEPKPVQPWEGVKEAKKPRISCAQLFSLIVDDPNKITGDEDCLYLNVYTPDVSKTASLPVLVYIHGGAFMFANSTPYKPDFLLEHIDLVFVSLNYRLGPFGFLSTEDEVVPGNNGLKDQMFALKWVQENIEAFGGNKDAVTISGNSAGGASVQYHYLSPLSRGLFHRGISSSGSSLMPWAFTEEPLQKAKKLADALGCETDTTRNMVQCLKGKPSKDIISKIELFMPWLYNPFTPFGPVIEKNAKSPFLSKHPYNLLKSGEVFQAPWLASITTEEGLYPAASFIAREDYMKSLDTDWLENAPHLLDYNFTAPENKKNYISKKIRHAYLCRNEITTQTANKIVEMVGDRLFKVDMDYATRILASVSSSPVFFLTLGYRGSSFSLSDLLTGTTNNYGVSHYDDMYFLMALPESFKLKSKLDISVIKIMTEIWTSFIKKGEPSLSNNIQWDPVPRDSATSGKVKYLFINDEGELSMKEDGDYGNKGLWVSLGLNENEHYK